MIINNRVRQTSFVVITETKLMMMVLLEGETGASAIFLNCFAPISFIVTITIWYDKGLGLTVNNALFSSV